MPQPISDSVWNDVLEYLRVRFEELVRGWFAQLKPISLNRGILTISTDNPPQVRYLNEHCRRAFGEALQASTGRIMTVQFESRQPDREPKPLSFENDDMSLQLTRDNRFENFITGPCNRLAHAAAVAASEQPGQAYNPLFVHGDVGLGKTHLLQAICHQVTSINPDCRLLYISCETFTNHFLEAVEHGALQQFRYRYRHVDLLVIDDIQFLAERERSQEEFFHTFNTLHQSERQIVLSADCSPEEIPSLQDRLVSRFNSGLVALVDRPCLETRMAIVRAKAKLRYVDVPEDVVKLIATRCESNVRELAGALSKIDLMSQTQGGKIDIKIAREAMGLPKPQTYVAIPEILNLVSSRYNVRLSDLQGKKRSRSIAFPRHICMYLARELTPLSLEEIGGYFGGRDHSTVIHAHRLITNRRTEDSELNESLIKLSTELKIGG